MKWFKEHKLFTKITGVVLVLILLITYSYSSLGSSTLLGKGVQRVTSVISRPITAVTTGISDFFTGVLSYKEIMAENENLRTQVDILEVENLQLQLTAQEYEELQELYQAFSFTPYSPSSNAVAGRVIEIDNSNPYVTFTIDVGTEMGVEKDDIVCDGYGLVGKVYETGNGYSKVVSVLNDGNNISFRVLRDQSITGVVAGNGEDGLDGYVMNEDDRIIKGDVLITTGIGVYPEGIKIGTVSKVDYDEDKQLKIIEVDPTVDFKGLQKVAVFL